MAKLIRCRSGHVFDSEAHAACPECARTETLDAENGGAPQGSGDAAQGEGGGAPSLPVNTLVLGGAVIALIVGGTFLLWPSSTQSPGNRTESRPSGAMLDPASDPDFQACAKSAPNDQTNCDRAIASGKFGGVPLARLYLIRGYRRNTQQNVDGAFSDFGEAIKLEPNNAFGLAGLGSVYVRKGDCAHAIDVLDQAIKLDPNIVIAYVGRGGCLWNKGDPDGARADYQKALSLNPDPDTKKSVEVVLEMLSSAAPDPKPMGTP
jgi:hypothetical protein